MEKNNIKSLFFAIIAVISIGVLIGGGTYAFWTWQTSDSQQTNVAFTISAPGFTIVGNNVSATNLAPTQTCYYQSNATGHIQHTLAGNATVTAENNTTAPMRATITLNGSLSTSSGKVLPTSGSNSAANIHWAIKKVSTASESYSTANCTGTAGSEYATGTFANITANGTPTDIPTSITFDVPAGETAVRNYQIYVWLDSDYTHTNIGSTNSDPMQGLTVTLTFSSNSVFTQDIS